MLLQTVYNYQKVVNCSVGAIQKTGVELNSSLPGTDLYNASKSVVKKFIYCPLKAFSVFQIILQLGNLDIFTMCPYSYFLKACLLLLR